MSAEAGGKRVEVKFELRAGNRSIEASASIPAAPLRPVDLLPVLHAFDEAFIGMVTVQAEEQGRKISCRAGCGACCRQLAPVSESEAWYLADLVASMPPERQARVRRRFEEALAELARHGMLERLRNACEELKDLDVRRAFGMEYFKLHIACPFLEDESCSIHPWRPMSCREYLVSSPAINCATPRPDNIERVGLPARFSEILFCFGDGAGNEATRWLPLALALEWAAAHDRASQPARPGPELFRSFVAQVAAVPDQR
ncbi:MAG: YkgJ family cysteine cluster protein [Acidobacteriota bacterium]